TSKILRHKLDYIFQNGAIPHHCVLGVSGKDVNLRITHVPFIPTRSRLQKMMQYEVLQIAGKSSDNIYADFKPLTIPNKPYPEIPVLVGLAKNTYIDDEIRYLKDIGIGLDDICPKVLALSNVLRVGGRVGQSETVLLIDIGAENSEVVIQQGKNLLFARNMTGGGNLLTEALKNRLGVSEEQAEIIKHTDGIMATDSGAPIKDALRGAIGQIESMLESAISFARTQLKIDDLAVDRILLSGGTARLKGLTEYLSNALAKPVEIFEPFQNIDTRRLTGPTL
ncbi:MAG: pilus assembly protein PilM, partial [Planctomycetes bacterium]|nr:pilus assembly protein PilM [Planctomycetota bacterium]